ACIGSFTNVVIHRLPCPLDEPNEFGDVWDTNPWRSVLGGDSSCADCGRKLTVADLIPVFSWLVLRGRCRDCGARIPAYHPLVEALVPALGVVAWVVVGWGWRLPLLLWLIPTGLAISVIDFQVLIVPTRIVWPSFFVAVAIAVAVALVIDQPRFLLNGLVGIAALAGPLFVIWFIMPSGMGFGDVRLATLLGWCVGFSSGRSYGHSATLSFLTLAAAAVLGLIIGIGALGARGRNAKVPFGPSLLIAGWAVALFAPTVIGQGPS
ncbi:MAG: prepilin peptidase, partial [Propionibacteriaceae bacterium]|nr:prepilin peptidase [Propionibacteriaceae bacterium]